MPKGKANGNGKASPPAPIPIDARVELVRKHKESGKISGRKPGRPGPEFEVGYQVDGKYFPGNPPKTGRGRKPAVLSIVKKKPGPKPGFKKKSGEMSELERMVESVAERIVERKLKEKLDNARAAAINAVSNALTL